MKLVDTKASALLAQTVAAWEKKIGCSKDWCNLVTGAYA